MVERELYQLKLKYFLSQFLPEKISKPKILLFPEGSYPSSRFDDGNWAPQMEVCGHEWDARLGIWIGRT